MGRLVIWILWSPVLGIVDRGQLGDVTCQQATVRVRYGPASTEQVLGALPVAAGLCRRLDIAGIIDRAVPAREIAHATHGQVIEALIANRLTAPSPMIHVGALATLRLRTATTDATPEIAQPDALQLRLLHLLDIDPRRTR
ncbi:DUF4277 domain-containing protein [Candidatus Mycobacterium methanotrophicum]|uniref:DUF4277 domain-containing protein n=1 Tax=Candidatus Mycobacterium methanotrophicum TaxID=2943498 RepID=A0ABY4QIH1_9MYCO|nr:DUF4277 domain-containing protein [Candidatus Mycobacterium methanotrophicum]UQX10339.1 DUF4277 domain-containing protein [Candidatus Mycobacterium methanotrophicum]